MNVKFAEMKWGGTPLFKSWGDKNKRLGVLFFIVLIALFWITRLWKLMQLPYGLHIDEACMAYSAWTLSEYGVDRYLNPWPIYIPNFDGGQSAMYTYICVILFKVFGYHLSLVRLPAVLFSFLNLVFGILTVKKIFPENNFIPLTTGGLIVVCPYFIMAGRFGLDCNLMLGMSTVFLYCFITAIESGMIRKYILAGVTGGLLLYTYALSYMVLPVFLLLSLLYVIRTKRFFLKGWFAMAVPMGILAFPLILVQIVNIFDLPQFQIGCFTITKMGVNRASELGMFSYKKLHEMFGVIFLGDTWNYNTAPGYVNLYGPTILFFFLGADIILRKFWNSIRGRKMAALTFVLLWFTSMLFLGALTEANVNRMNGIFFSTIFFAAVGINGLCMMLKKHFVAVAVVVGGIYLMCFGKFAGYYFGGAYTEENYLLSYFDVPVTEAVEFIEEDSVLSKKTTQMAEQGIYYALGNLKSPYDLNMREIDMEHRTEHYMFGTLGGIEDQYNYIVFGSFVEYSEELRAAGFSEEYYGDYSLFYKK